MCIRDRFTLGATIVALSALVLLLWGRRLAEIRSGGALRGHIRQVEPEKDPPLEPHPAAGR
jgi:hypothetical protein